VGLVANEVDLMEEDEYEEPQRTPDPSLVSSHYVPMTNMTRANDCAALCEKRTPPGFFDTTFHMPASGHLFKSYKRFSVPGVKKSKTTLLGRAIGRELARRGPVKARELFLIIKEFDEVEQKRQYKIRTRREMDASRLRPLRRDAFLMALHRMVVRGEAELRAQLKISLLEMTGVFTQPNVWISLTYRAR